MKWTGTNIIKSQGNAFDWRGKDSIFLNDPAFWKNHKMATASSRRREETESDGTNLGDKLNLPGSRSMQVDPRLFHVYSKARASCKSKNR